MALSATDSNVKLIRGYFELGNTALTEIRKLTDTDKEELGDGIRALLKSGEWNGE